MKHLPLCIAVLALAGCARPPKLTTSLDIQKKSNDLVLVKLQVVNMEDRPTVPIAIELTGQTRVSGHWSKPEMLLHPAAFVLNRKEQREITKLWRVSPEAVRTTLVVKEQESGNILKTEKSEKAFNEPPPAPSAPTSPQSVLSSPIPATPRLPGT